MSRSRVATWMRVVLGIAGVAAVVACGGGGSVGSGGTGAPLGVAVGTVNGFGSVIVDGQRFDDRGARAVQEDTPGHDAAVEVKLGHRVEIEFEQDDVVRTLRIEATLAGPVTSVNPAQLVVLGQTVRVNGDPANGPVTQFGGGYTAAADVKAGDVVEVHGIVVPQVQGSIVQATRIEKEDALPPFLRVTGTVSDLAAGAFKLGSLAVTTANATIVPAGTALANGQVVRVMAPPAALTGSTLAATQVRIKNLAQGGGRTAVVSGAVGSLDTTASTFLVGTQKVDYSAATLVPPGTVPANGQYVRVRGQFGSDGTLMATQVVLRDGRGDEAEAELHGNITGFDAGTQTFTIRDVRVDASRVTPRNCPPTGLADGLFVEVEGTLSSTTVIATRVQCEGEPPGATVEREGTVASVDAAAQRFVLATLPGGSTLNVTWSDLTFFRGVTPDTLAGKHVEVEGVLGSDGTLAASKVKRKN